MQRHIISILIIKGQFIDSLLRRKFSTQSLETRSHHLSILVAENSLINVFNLTILMRHCINMANFSVFLCASPQLSYRSTLREFPIIIQSICSWAVFLSNVQFSVWENGWDKLLKHHKIPLSYQDNLFRVATLFFFFFFLCVCVCFFFLCILCP